MFRWVKDGQSQHAYLTLWHSVATSWSSAILHDPHGQIDSFKTFELSDKMWQINTNKNHLKLSQTLRNTDSKW